jgi:hypothetical protein
MSQSGDVGKRQADRLTQIKAKTTRIPQAVGLEAIFAQTVAAVLQKSGERV